MKPATATPTRITTTNPITGFTNDLKEQIRRRAYEFYLERGREDGMTWPIGCKPSRR